MGKKPKQNKNKYIENLQNDDNYIDPRLVYKAIRDKTLELISIFAERRFVTILTKVDLHRYIVYQIPLHDPKNQLWVAGNTFVINQNPESKVIIRSFCMKTRKWCCGFEGNISNEFFTLCPECNSIMVAVKDSTLPCDYCKRNIEADTIKHLPFIKYSCVNCPAHIGLDEANLNKDYALNNLLPRE